MVAALSAEPNWMTQMARSQQRHPFADWAPGTLPASDDGATRVFQVPRELIEIARARDPGATAGTLTPLVPAPTPEMSAAVSAYTAPCSALRSRTDMEMQDLARQLPVARGSMSSRAALNQKHPTLRTCLISMGLALLALLAYHMPSLLARL